MEPVINFSHVTKEYPLYHHIGSGIKDLVFHPKRAFQLLKGRKYLAIEDITFTVGKGEAVALIGRNGAGKSTSSGWWPASLSLQRHCYNPGTRCLNA